MLEDPYSPREEPVSRPASQNGSSSSWQSAIASSSISSSMSDMPHNSTSLLFARTNGSMVMKPTMKQRVAIQSNESPAQAGAGEPGKGEDVLPASEEQRLNALRSHLHDAAFSFLRSGACRQARRRARAGGARAGCILARIKPHVLTPCRLRCCTLRKEGTATRGP
jgi:hypothetical protein